MNPPRLLRNSPYFPEFYAQMRVHSDSSPWNAELGVSLHLENVFDVSLFYRSNFTDSQGGGVAAQVHIPLSDSFSLRPRIYSELALAKNLVAPSLSARPLNGSYPVVGFESSLQIRLLPSLAISAGAFVQLEFLGGTISHGSSGSHLLWVGGGTIGVHTGLLDYIRSPQVENYHEDAVSLTHAFPTLETEQFIELLSLQPERSVYELGEISSHLDLQDLPPVMLRLILACVMNRREDSLSARVRLAQDLVESYWVNLNRLRAGEQDASEAIRNMLDELPCELHSSSFESLATRLSNASRPIDAFHNAIQHLHIACVDLTLLPRSQEVVLSFLRHRAEQQGIELPEGIANANYALISAPEEYYMRLADGRSEGYSTSSPSQIVLRTRYHSLHRRFHLLVHEGLHQYAHHSRMLSGRSDIDRYRLDDVESSASSFPRLLEEGMVQQYTAVVLDDANLRSEREPTNDAENFINNLNQRYPGILSALDALVLQGNANPLRDLVGPDIYRELFRRDDREDIFEEIDRQGAQRIEEALRRH